MGKWRVRYLIDSLECRDTFPKSLVLKVQRLELLLDISEDGMEPGLGVVWKKDGVVVARTPAILPET